MTGRLGWHPSALLSAALAEMEEEYQRQNGAGYQERMSPMRTFNKYAKNVS